MSDNAFDEYSSALSGFVKNLAIRNIGKQRNYPDDRVNRIIEVNVTKDALSALFNEIYDILENDEVMQNNLGLYSDIFGAQFDHDYVLSLSVLKELLNDFNRDYSGDIKVLFFLDRENRLLRAVINADIEYGNDISEFQAALDFGSSLTDMWLFSFGFVNDTGTDMIFIQWSYEEQSETFTNTMQITTDEMDFFNFKSAWEQGTGRLKLGYESGSEVSEIAGTFIANEKSFLLTLDNVFPVNSDIFLMIEMTAQAGSQINEIDFINIDKWGNTLVEAVIRFIFRMIF